MKSLAEKLVDRYGTRDPFKIAKYLDYIMVQTPLVGIRGFYDYKKRNHFIYIDSELDECQQQFVCAHELGHSLLHRGLNRIFMDTKTHFKTSCYEREANEFAVELLISDSQLEPFLEYPVERVAKYFNLEEELVRYRFAKFIEEYSDSR